MGCEHKDTHLKPRIRNEIQSTTVIEFKSGQPVEREMKTTIPIVDNVLKCQDCGQVRELSPSEKAKSSWRPDA